MGRVLFTFGRVLFTLGRVLFTLGRVLFTLARVLFTLGWVLLTFGQGPIYFWKIGGAPLLMGAFSLRYGRVLLIFSL